MNRGLANAGFETGRIFNTIGHGVASPFHSFDWKTKSFNFSMGNSYHSLNSWLDQKQNWMDHVCFSGANHNSWAFQGGHLTGNVWGDFAIGGGIMKGAEGVFGALNPAVKLGSNTQRLANPRSQSWTNSINPFKGKTFQEIDQLFRAKGFAVKGPDPLHGKGSYFSPLTNRKYYLDYAGKTYRGGTIELPHVDVHYNMTVNGIKKQRFPIGKYLYELE